MTQPLRYRLDDLGWYQFEALIQAVLKAELGIGVEAWGGRGDHGRDAFCPGKLAYPSRHEPSEGPFIFQAKFVEEANAAGADPAPVLKKAVTRELERVERRISELSWDSPRQFVLVTNVSIQAGLRKELQEQIAARLGTQASVMAGADVCASLDAHPHMRRSFPQLLGLRDLNALLAEVVDRVVLERSRAAVESARELVPVFVPTWAYDRAWDVLQKHRFLVLEGPPEMGKTAIAWMIGLAQLANGWQVIDCDGPGDFFRRYDPEASQFFVADDAFGRTEYDPTRASEWERQISRVLRSLDGRHWLAWTARRHIIERAKRTLDIQGLAQGFPDPAAVTVDAAFLSEREKALMLYRHARAARLPNAQKNIVRAHASAIVKDKHFTPERIRRFVRERLKELAETTEVSAADLRLLVLEEIRDPTERMRKTFRALPEAHKWLLVAQVDTDERGSVGELKARWGELCPLERQRSFEEILEELSESFLRVYRIWDPPTVDWAHPSYRDLVVEELAGNVAMRSRFLAHMSVRGVLLALSDAGGATGARALPLLQDHDAWTSVTERCRKLLQIVKTWQAKHMFAAIVSALDVQRTEDERRRLAELARHVCMAAKEAWDRHEVSIDAELLALFTAASTAVSPLPAVPALDASWASSVEWLDHWITNANEYSVEEASSVTEWMALASAIMRVEPRFLVHQRFPDAFEERVKTILEKMQEMTSATPDGEMSQRQLREAAETIESLKDTAVEGARVAWGHATTFATMEHALAATAEEFAEAARADEDGSDRPDPEYGDEVSIDQLFSDL